MKLEKLPLNKWEVGVLCIPEDKDANKRDPAVCPRGPVETVIYQFWPRSSKYPWGLTQAGHFSGASFPECR